MRTVVLAGVVVAATAWVLWGAAAKFATPSAPVAGSVPVIAGSATTRDLPIWISAIGTVQPLNSVNVRVRVDGQLQKANFVEGQEVRAGDLLAQLDPRPFQAQLRQAEANLLKDQAQLTHASAELIRYIGLAEKGFVPTQNVDALRAQVASLEATAAADRAMIETASLQLGFTTITSPITGRVGLRQVDPGSIVHATDANGLVTITQMRPIAVLFSLSQDELPELLARRAQGKLPVTVHSRDGLRHLADGELAFVDSQVDPGTGQIKMKAVFANADGALWPGEFVSTRLLLRTDHAAIVVPSRAVMSGREGQYVYVVKGDSTVEARAVATGAVVEEFTVLRSGIAPGEAVVFDGQSRLAPGARVEVKRAPVSTGAGPPS